MSLFLFQPSSINERACLFALPVVDDAPFSNRMRTHSHTHTHILKNACGRGGEEEDDDDEIERYHRVMREKGQNGLMSCLVDV